MDNRAIKFRAWDKRFNKMVYGSPFAILYLEGSDHQIMQFTGLKDKNGKEIYEGDILHCKTYGMFYEIIYSQESCSFRLKDTKGLKYSNRIIPFASLELVGNIYENPNLLK